MFLFVRLHARHPAALVPLTIMLTACGAGSSPPRTGIPPPPPPPPQQQFSDVTASSGIDFTNGLVSALDPTDLGFIASSGVAAGDFDDDGDIDLFIVRGDMGPNLLYRNSGNLVFDEVAAAAGLANTRSATANYRHSGPMFADMDGDGDLDLFVGGLGGDPSLLFRNNGDSTFSDVTAGSGIDTLTAANNISAAFGDYDLDGDLDLFVSHWGIRHHFVTLVDTQHLWRNDTDASGIRFTSVSESAGISSTILTLPDASATQELRDYTFAPTFARINDDLYPDILSVADFDYSQFFINNQNGTFSNATDPDVITDGNGMGSAVADYDNDGDLDWFVTSIECHQGSDCNGGMLSKIGNRLYANEDGTFVDRTNEAGVASGGWGWGACFIDFENDGDLDIYHTNGWPLTDTLNDFMLDASRAFVSDGQGHFDDKAEELGLADTEQGRGVVCADFDNDGDVDILQLHRSDTLAATLWRNDNDRNNFLAIKLNGIGPNTQASGARIKVTSGVITQLREITIGSNFASQNPTVQTFGLGNAAQADVVAIQWPDGLDSTLTNVPAGQTITVDHPDLL